LLPTASPVHWDLVVGEQVEKSVLLSFQFLELATQGGVQFRDAALFALVGRSTGCSSKSKIATVARE
jgi:hypothetical protein